MLRGRFVIRNSGFELVQENALNITLYCLHYCYNMVRIWTLAPSRANYNVPAVHCLYERHDAFYYRRIDSVRANAKEM